MCHCARSKDTKEVKKEEEHRQTNSSRIAFVHASFVLFLIVLIAATMSANAKKKQLIFDWLKENLTKLEEVQRDRYGKYIDRAQKTAHSDLIKSVIEDSNSDNSQTLQELMNSSQKLRAINIKNTIKAIYGDCCVNYCIENIRGESFCQRLSTKYQIKEKDCERWISNEDYYYVSFSKNGNVFFSIKVELYDKHGKIIGVFRVVVKKDELYSEDYLKEFSPYIFFSVDTVGKQILHKEGNLIEGEQLLLHKKKEYFVGGRGLRPKVEIITQKEGTFKPNYFIFRIQSKHYERAYFVVVKESTINLMAWKRTIADLLPLWIVSVILLMNIYYTAYQYTKDRELQIKQAVHKISQTRGGKTLYHPVLKIGNRFKYCEDVKRLIGKAKNQVWLIIFVELRSLYAINDGYSIQEEDAILVDFSLFLYQKYKEHAYHIGGDKFIVLLSEEGNQLREEMNEISNFLKYQIMIDNIHIPVQFSCGISTYPQDGLEPWDLLTRAELACSCARKLENQDYLMYRSSMLYDVDINKNLSCYLKSSMDTNMLQLWCRPVIDVIHMQVAYVKVFLKIEKPFGGYYDTIDVIHASEKYGIYQELFWYIMHRLCEEIRRCDARGKHFRYCVNVSLAQLKDDVFFRTYTQLLAQESVDIRRIEFELYETNETMSYDDIIGTLYRLQSMGVVLTLGSTFTGISNVKYLPRLPIAKVKIDASLLRYFKGSRKEYDYIAGLVNMVHVLNIEVVAIGVEDARLAECMMNEEFEYAQGNYYACEIELSQLSLSYSFSDLFLNHR